MRAGVPRAIASRCKASRFAEYIFETASGAFEDGGCKGKRSTLNGDKIAGYKSGSDVTVAYGKCVGEPPFPCQIYSLSASA